MKTIKIILLIGIIAGFTNTATAQEKNSSKIMSDIYIKNSFLTKKELKSEYFQGTYYLYNEKYSQALHVFSKLLKNDPENSNLSFYVGICYYHLEKYDISKIYLEDAANNISEDYKDSVFEKNAPSETQDFLNKINELALVSE
ncbi:MAG: tetratricopeptide repeat protein [Bacteroidetes bacterium]|nr:tetratricopeptide repeat protein [Bacteroidota bacterium]